MKKPRSEVAAPLSIELDCPKCGAPFAVDDEEVVTVTCEHCASLLVLSHPEREEIYIADGVVREAAETLEICLLYRIQAQRAEIVSRYRDGEGNPPPEMFVQNRLAAFERKLRERAALHECHGFHAPYWHISGKIVQGILGRQGDVKLAKVRAYVVEHTLPGYAADRFNLRDRGLRLARSKVRPLTRRDGHAHARFLPFQAVPEQQYREIDRWLRRDLDPRIEPIVQHGRFLAPQRILVYRPYWLSLVTLDRGARWVLLDGSFSTVAGYPDEGEVRALLAHCVENPLPGGDASHLDAHVAASRCPDCGADAEVDPHAVYFVCRNCQRLLSPTLRGLKLGSYDHAAPPGLPPRVEYLPFWRFSFTLTFPDGQRVENLADYAAALFPQALPSRFHPRGEFLWVPAFRLLTTEAGDNCFKLLIEWIHGGPPPVAPGKLPLGGGDPVFRGAALDEEAARALAHFALVGLHGKTSAARLNAITFRQRIEEPKLELGEARLVMVPFLRQRQELVAPGVRVPILLLDGGPALDAQRLSVQAAARAL
jgi:Zn finger protein HypA/HybF involved in hydrogenase expression